MAALHLIRASQLRRPRTSAARRARAQRCSKATCTPTPPPRLGLDADTAVTVVALRVEDPDDRRAFLGRRRRRIERVVGLVALYFESFQRQVAQVTIGETIYVLIPETPRRRARPPPPADRRPRRASPATVHTRIVSGVGSTVPSIAATSWSRREADLAIRVLAAHPGRSVAPIEDVRAETIVLALRDLGLGDAYLRSGPVEALRLHDARNGTSYVETLSAYFSAFGYVPLAAKPIFVHPNTFRYRLRRLTEISGLDLDDPVRAPRRRTATAHLRHRRGDRPVGDPAGHRTRSRQTGAPRVRAARTRSAAPRRLSDSRDMANDHGTLQQWVSEAAERLAVPGVAVGVFHAGEEHYAFHGVTSVENPLPVDEHTLFQFGSTGKTFTATAILRLVEQGHVDLDATVRTYVPELTLQDEDVAQRVTVLQLLNHTAGWSGDLFENTGDGDDALARYVELMADVEQVTPLGATVSYNNASLSVAGRIIEKVTGQDLRAGDQGADLRAARSRSQLLLPERHHDAAVRRRPRPARRRSITVARPWALPRSGNPAGGISSNAADQIAWARFHLGDGRAPDGTAGAVREAAAPDAGADGRDARQRARRRGRHQLAAPRRRRGPRRRPRRRHARPALVVRHGARARLRHRRADQLRAERPPAHRRASALGARDVPRRRRSRSRAARARRRRSWPSTPAPTRRSPPRRRSPSTATRRPRPQRRDQAGDAGQADARTGEEPPDDTRRSRSASCPATAIATSSSTARPRGCRATSCAAPTAAVESVHVGGRLATRVAEVAGGGG